MEKIITFKFDRETKGTKRFKEVIPEGETMVIGTLYLRKDFLGENSPEEVKVILSW